jgi:hypothetical protein
MENEFGGKRLLEASMWRIIQGGHGLAREPHLFHANLSAHREGVIEAYEEAYRRSKAGLLVKGDDGAAERTHLLLCQRLEVANTVHTPFDEMRSYLELAVDEFAPRPSGSGGDTMA